MQGKLKETFKKQYKLTTWVEVQIRYKTVWVISPAGIPVPTQVPYEYKIFHTKLVNRGLEVVIREELDNDQWKRYEIFQDTLGGRPYLFNGGLPMPELSIIGPERIHELEPRASADATCALW